MNELIAIQITFKLQNFFNISPCSEIFFFFQVWIILYSRAIIYSSNFRTKFVDKKKWNNQYERISQRR